MALLPQPVPKPTYPNVPNVPGVPPVLRQFGAIQAKIVLLEADAFGVLNFFGPPLWGLYAQDGSVAIPADSVIDVAYRQDSRIGTAPQEQGAFLSYNKVQLPYDLRVTFSKGGSAADRSEFLQAIISAQISLNMMTLIIPELSYVGVNVVHNEWRRAAAQGVSRILVEVWLEQVNPAGPPQFTSTAAPSGANAVNGGAVQPQPTTPGVNYEPGGSTPEPSEIPYEPGG